MRNKKHFEYKSKGLCTRCGDIPLPDKTRCKPCHEAALAYNKTFRKKNTDKNMCRNCCKEPRLPNKSMCQECLSYHAKHARQLHKEQRDACIKAYGGKCACCGITIAKYLQIDHINNDGADHRETIWGRRRGGGSLAEWAVRNNFPKIFQLLCCNCHQAKTHYGGCTPQDHDAMNTTSS